MAPPPPAPAPAVAVRRGPSVGRPTGIGVKQMLPRADFFDRPAKAFFTVFEPLGPIVLFGVMLTVWEELGWEVEWPELSAALTFFYGGVSLYLAFHWAVAFLSGEMAEDQFTKRYDRFPRGAGIRAFWSEARAMFLVSPFGITMIYAIRTGKIGKVYHDVDDYGWPYLIASYFMGLLIQDTAFYWEHRALHHPSFWRWHVEHHEYFTGRTLNVFSAVAQSLAEITFEGIGIVFLPSLVIPMHHVVAANMMPVSFALWTTSNHMIAPHSIPGGFINDRKCHQAHHKHGQKNGNYAFYFTHWDRIFNTVIE